MRGKWVLENLLAAPPPPPPPDIPALKEKGIVEVFQPGTDTREIIQTIRENLKGMEDA